MPKYRLFTSMETINIVPDNNAKVKVIRHLADMLPAFLSSYHNCNHGGLLSGIEYSDKAQPLNQFLEGVNGFISDMKLTMADNEWVSFVISPVEIILETDDRRISNLTDWSCFSKIGNVIISDFNYTYDLKEEYIYSQKVRSTSDDQEFFIHSSGDFAVEVFSTGFSFFTRKADFQLMATLQNKSFCIIDISGCDSVKVEAIANWCNENNYRFIELADEKDKILISHMYFDLGSVGSFLPGILTWREWDDLNFDSEDFLDKLPYGSPVELIEKKRIFNNYFQQCEQLSDLCLLNQTQTLCSEALCHTERLIRFVSYIEPINMAEYEEYLTVANQSLKEVCEHFKLYYDPYEDIADVILEVQPLLTHSTHEAIYIVEKIYHNLIVSLSTNSDQRKNMAFYVKYHLDRWLPENLVRKD